MLRCWVVQRWWQEIFDRVSEPLEILKWEGWLRKVESSMIYSPFFCLNYKTRKLLFKPRLVVKREHTFFPSMHLSILVGSLLDFQGPENHPVLCIFRHLQHFISVRCARHSHEGEKRGAPDFSQSQPWMNDKSAGGSLSWNLTNQSAAAPNPRFLILKPL